MSLFSNIVLAAIEENGKTNDREGSNAEKDHRKFIWKAIRKNTIGEINKEKINSSSDSFE